MSDDKYCHQSDAELKRKELEERAKQETEKENAILGGLRPKVGRPEKITSMDKIAEEVGIPRTTLIDAQKHVDAVNQYPELENEPDALSFFDQQAVKAQLHAKTRGVTWFEPKFNTSK